MPSLKPSKPTISLNSNSPIIILSRYFRREACASICASARKGVSPLMKPSARPDQIAAEPLRTQTLSPKLCVSGQARGWMARRRAGMSVKEAKSLGSVAEV